LLLRASSLLLHCQEAQQRSDRSAALAYLCDLREVIRELEGVEQPLERELARLRSHESKLARALSE
jgi:hypothetical protein